MMCTLGKMAQKYGNNNNEKSTIFTNYYETIDIWSK